MLKYDDLKSLSLCASTEETRYYLRGVYVEYKDGFVNGVATDGHRLLAVHRKSEFCSDTAQTLGLDEGIIIPLDAIKKLKVKKSLSHYPLTLDKATDKKYILGCAGEEIIFEPVDGTFPDWKKVVPFVTEPEPAGPQMTAQFNGKYLADFEKMPYGAPMIHHNGPSNPAVISFETEPGGDVIGVIMPMRREMSIPHYPWATSNYPTQEAEAIAS
jgi:DNA polymerase III sliding clamp (beta) subunit (PCNA family)